MGREQAMRVPHALGATALITTHFDKTLGLTARYASKRFVNACASPAATRGWTRLDELAGASQQRIFTYPSPPERTQKAQSDVERSTDPSRNPRILTFSPDQPNLPP